MKSIYSIFLGFISLVFSLILCYWFLAIPSAFEADQFCHSLLAIYPENPQEYGCDHDTETHQWILFQKKDNSDPAKIIKRFRYRFL